MEIKEYMQNKYIKMLFVATLAFFGGYIFEKLGIYLPWMLGPLFVILIAKMKFGSYFYWSKNLRSLGLVILGVQLGSSFTKEALFEMVHYLPLMLISTITITLLTIIMGWFIAKWMNLSLGTALLGSFPGGLSQMVILSEELKNVDESIVAFMQTFRVIFVISIVPWIVTHLMVRESNDMLSGEFHSFFLFQYDVKWALILFVILVLLIYVGKYIRFPLPHLLGPLLAATLFNLVGPGAPEIPDFWLNASQLMIGAHLGLTLKVNNPKLFRKMFGVICISNIILILFCLVVAKILWYYSPVGVNELFLSIAPGGVAEMSVTALSIDVDVSVVTSFHLFRILFILFIISPFIKWISIKLSK